MSAADVAKAVLELLGKGIAKKLLGVDDAADLPSIEAAIKRAVPDALAAAQARLEALIRQEIQALGLVLQIRDLADDTAKVLDAFEPKGDIPPLGLDITILGPGEKLEDTTIQPLDEKIDPGDGK